MEDYRALGGVGVGERGVLIATLIMQKIIQCNKTTRTDFFLHFFFFLNICFHVALMISSAVFFVFFLLLFPSHQDLVFENDDAVGCEIMKLKLL